MRQRLLIIFTIVLVLGVLIALNALNYSRPNRQPESELAPNRSTYNAGATGTRALYDLLSESGYKVTRWREPVAKLSGETGARVGTFVLLGPLQRPISQDEAGSVLRWVDRGGRLVIIDRMPNVDLLPKSGQWTISTEVLRYPELGIDPSDSERMTEGTVAVHPLQPTLLTRAVRTIRPSRFASAIRLNRATNAKVKPEHKASSSQSSESGGSEETDDEFLKDEAPVHRTDQQAANEESAARVSPAPVVHANTPAKLSPAPVGSTRRAVG